MSQHISFHASVRDSYAQIATDPNVNWLLFGYAQNELKLTASGASGLEELRDEFNDGLMQFAYAKVVDPGSGIPRFVLISWCGEGVPVLRKGCFNQHTVAVAQFFKGFSVHIQARSIDDVDPQAITKKIMDSSGAKYSVQAGVANPSIAKPSPPAAKINPVSLQTQVRSQTITVAAKPPSQNKPLEPPVVQSKQFEKPPVQTKLFDKPLVQSKPTQNSPVQSKPFENPQLPKQLDTAVAPNKIFTATNTAFVKKEQPEPPASFVPYVPPTNPSKLKSQKQLFEAKAIVPSYSPVKASEAIIDKKPVVSGYTPYVPPSTSSKLAKLPSVKSLASKAEAVPSNLTTNSSGKSFIQNEESNFIDNL